MPTIAYFERVYERYHYPQYPANPLPTHIIIRHPIGAKEKYTTNNILHFTPLKKSARHYLVLFLLSKGGDGGSFKMANAFFSVCVHVCTDDWSMLRVFTRYYFII